MNIKEKRERILHLELQMDTLINKCKKKKGFTSINGLQMLIYGIQSRMIYSEMLMVIAQPTKE